MTLSKRAQYGLRALICFADAYEHGYLQTRELAAREGIPSKFLESILSTLAHGKFLVSKIGASGGYRLARPPRTILIGDIMASLEGKKFLEDVLHFDADPKGTPPTERPGEVAVKLIQLRISSAVQNVLKTTTLAALADQVMQQSGGQMYYI